MRPYTLPLADPNATLDIAGGKGASLSKLAKAGLPVPGGFHVTTTAYKQFVAENDIAATLIPEKASLEFLEMKMDAP